MGLCIDQASGSRDGDVIGCALIEANGQELAQSEGVGHSPSDAPFAVDPFEEPDHYDAEVLARRQRWPSEFVVIEASALSFTEAIEPRSVEHLVETPIERVARSRSEFTVVPEALLSLPLLASTHRHTSDCRAKTYSVLHVSVL